MKVYDTQNIKNIAVAVSYTHLQGVKGILKDYEERSILLNREIFAVGQQEVRKGTCVGFTETGALLFQSDGKIEELDVYKRQILPRTVPDSRRVYDNHIRPDF